MVGLGQPGLTGYFPGSRQVVSLPASQQRVLHEIEDDLRGCEPRLVSMFAIFTRLTRDDGLPRSESLRPPAAGLRRTITQAVILGLMALFVFMAVIDSAGPGCSPVSGPQGSAKISAQSCQSAQQPPGHL
jgi:hypothetical protein